MARTQDTNTLAMILAGGMGTRLLPLTRRRCKPAVHFGGNFRIVDYTLMNCISSGVRNIDLLTQYRADSVWQHCRRRWLPLRHSNLTSLPAGVGNTGAADGYRGTADAVYKNLERIVSHQPDVVLILSGDHIYHADYRPLIAAHLERNADVTILTGRASVAQARSFGVVDLDDDDRITQFVEKPANPLPYARSGMCPINLGVYCFRPEFLIEKLLDDARDPDSAHDFGKDILPGSVASSRVISCGLDTVAPSGKPYWRDVGTLDSFFEAHMDLLRDDFMVTDPRWPADSPFRAWAGGLTRRGEPDGAGGVRNLVSQSASIGDGDIRNCVIFPRVSIERGCSLEDCIVFPGARIGRGARLRRAIVEEAVQVPPGTAIGDWHGRPALQVVADSDTAHIAQL